MRNNIYFIKVIVIIITEDNSNNDKHINDKIIFIIFQLLFP